MPGIAGLIAPGPVDSRSLTIKTMVNSMVHESFYQTGTLSVDALEICCGWTSFKGSFPDCMPVWNEAKDVCLLFSGERFSNSGELTFFRARGHAPNKDASALMHLYEEHGLGFIRWLNGW